MSLKYSVTLLFLLLVSFALEKDKFYAFLPHCSQWLGNRNSKGEGKSSSATLNERRN